MGITTKNYFQKIFDKNLEQLKIKHILCFSLILLLFVGTFASPIPFLINYSRNVNAEETSVTNTSSTNTNSTNTSTNTSSNTTAENNKKIANVELQYDQSITVDNATDAQITHVKDWAAWKIEPGDQFHIHLLSSPELNNERMEAIHDAVFSKETLVVDGQTFYKGWYAAMESTAKNTKFPMHIDFHTVSTDDVTSQILIELTNVKNPDRYIGFTKSITDNDIHHLIKSKDRKSTRLNSSHRL